MCLGKAVIYLGNQEFESAKELSKKIISIDPNYILGLYSLALSEFGLGNFDETLKLANEGLKKFNNYYKCMFI